MRNSSTRRSGQTRSPTAVLTAGSFVPAFQAIFNILPQTTDSGLIYGMAGICIFPWSGDLRRPPMTTQQLVAFLFLLAPLAVADVAALTLLKPWARTAQAGVD